MYVQTFVIVLFRILQFAILARAILSWVMPDAPYRYPFLAIVWQITEPILAPIRRFASTGAMDLSPIIALILLQVVEGMLLTVLGVR